MEFQRSIRIRKIILSVVVVVSFLPTLYLVDFSAFGTGNQTWAIVARVTAIVGTLLLFWMVVLSARGLFGKWIVDLMWLQKIHNFAGKYGFLLIALHPICIIIYLNLQRNINLFQITPDNPTYIYIIMGEVAFVALVVIWLSSALLRRQLTYRDWRRMHLLTYAIVPLVLLHNLGLGGRQAQAAASDLYWVVLSGAFAAITIYQICFYTGWLRGNYEVVAKVTEAENITTLQLKHKRRNKIHPRPGQFVYLQYPLVLELHPFSVTNYDPNTEQIWVSFKDSGAFSHLLEGVQVGDALLIDGAYGMFTSELKNAKRDIVLLAGGIGVAPFIYNLRQTQKHGKQIYLFYGNKTKAGTGFISELQQLSQQYPDLHVTHVIQDEEVPGLECGLICEDLLVKYLPQDCQSYEYFVCGPPAMLSAMMAMLKSAGVPKSQVHFEKFGE